MEGGLYVHTLIPSFLYHRLLLLWTLDCIESSLNHEKVIQKLLLLRPLHACWHQGTNKFIVFFKCWITTPCCRRGQSWSYAAATQAQDQKQQSGCKPGRTLSVQHKTISEAKCKQQLATFSVLLYEQESKRTNSWLLHMLKCGAYTPVSHFCDQTHWQFQSCEVTQAGDT